MKAVKYLLKRFRVVELSTTVNVQMYAVLLLNGVKIRTSMVSLFHGHMTYHLSMKPL